MQRLCWVFGQPPAVKVGAWPRWLVAHPSASHIHLPMGGTLVQGAPLYLCTHIDIYIDILVYREIDQTKKSFSKTLDNRHRERLYSHGLSELEFWSCHSNGHKRTSGHLRNAVLRKLKLGTAFWFKAA